MSDDGKKDEGISQSFSFRVGPQTRKVNDEAVEALDAALAAVGQGEVMHFMDPQRINAFRSGGPPTWSVAMVPVEGGALYLTYGFSKAIDPDMIDTDFELSIRVPGDMATWPALFLRALARYMIQSRRELEVGQYMPFPGPLTRFFMAPEEEDSAPETQMAAAFFTLDPMLGKISTPKGDVQVRRAVGMHPQELELMELWSTQGYVQVVAGVDPTLTTDIARPPYTEDPQFVEKIHAGSREHGSDFGFVAVPGVTWKNDEDGLQFLLPGGAHAQRIYRMIQARLPFGRHLLVHDTDPQQQRAIAFEPGDEVALQLDGEDVIVMSAPADHELIATLVDAPDEGLRWTLS